MVFWDQSQSQLLKISKIPRLSHQNHDRRSEFSIFSFEFFISDFSDSISFCIRT
jgi:hypothetical protein